jgi:hypothetical protein
VTILFKNILSIIIAFIVGFSSFAQNKVDTTYKKNHLNIAFGNMFSIEANSSYSTTFLSSYFSITYKKFINPKNAFRIGTTYTYGDSRFMNQKHFNDRNYKQRFRLFEFDILIGHEHRFGKKKTKFILGEDFILGYKKAFRGNENFSQGSIFSNYTDSYIRLGAALNLGAEYDINKNFTIGINSKPELVLLNLINNKNSSYYSTEKMRVTFYLRSELTFSYKF